jgi:hypothetical protein
LRTKSKVLHAVSILILTIGTLSLAAAPAHASAKHASCGTTESAAARAAAINKLAADAAKAGKDVQSALLSGGFCLTPMTGTTSGGIRPAHSVYTDVTLTKPGFLYDSMAHDIVVTAEWDWKSADDANSDFGSGCCYLGPDGKADAFAIAFSATVHFVGYSIEYNGNGGWDSASSTNPTAKNNAGVGWEFQDTLELVAARAGENLNVMHGFLSAEVTELGTCSVDVFGTYTHTWSSTGVDGISISVPLGISFSYSSSGSQWQTPGPSSDVYNLCTH